MQSSTVGLRALGSYLPPRAMNLEELAAAGKLVSDAGTLADLGWKQARVAEGETASDLAGHVIEAIFATGIDPESVDVLVVCGATVSSFYIDGVAPDADDLWAHFRYPSARMLDRFGMGNATVVPVIHQGCNTLFTGIRLARALILAEPNVSRVLCVSADVIPAAAQREVLFSVLSDASCAVLVERDCPINEIVWMEQTTKGYFWDPSALQSELMAGYFPTARNVISRTMTAAGLGPADLRWVVPHNVSLTSWKILMSLLRWPEALLYAEGIASGGHSVSSDNIINLQSIQERDMVRTGDHLLLFTFGFGASWSAMVLKH